MSKKRKVYFQLNEFSQVYLIREKYTHKIKGRYPFTKENRAEVFEQVQKIEADYNNG